MKNQNEALVDFFNRAIQKNMQKVDSSNFEQRAIVYRAAFSSLQKVHSKNPTLSEAVKKHQVEIVSSVVEHTENQFLHHKKEPDVEVKPTIHPDLETQETILKDDLSHISLDQADSRSEAPDFREDNEKDKSKSFFHGKRLKIIGFACFVLAGILSYLVYTMSQGEDDKVALNLPLVILADEELLKSAKARGESKVYLAKDGQGGLVFELPANRQADTSGAEVPELGRLDFILRGELAEKLNQYQGEMLITFHLKKLTEDNLDIVLVYRAAGRPDVKNFQIIDNQENEYFILREERQGAQPRPNAVFSIRVKSKTDKLNKKPRLRMEKIVLSNI
jgi:hypothetical protein